jgi:hypothetical protein
MRGVFSRCSRVESRWRVIAPLALSFSVAVVASCGDDDQNAALGAGAGLADGGGDGATDLREEGGDGATGDGSATDAGSAASDVSSPADAEAGAVPAGWSCYYFAYADGKCDCGCGAPDIDCPAQGIADCQVCQGNGGCGDNACPGNIDRSDVTACAPVPSGWTCPRSAYGDGVCDCGCGALDVDCADASVASCQSCTAAGSCANGPCPSSIASNDNRRCAIPADWTCTASTYGDGTCNCGCGVVDVDCADATAASCQVCDTSSCSPNECMVEPNDNALCPSPPPMWRCPARLYHDGLQCDCGCGAADPDCTSISETVCDSCDDPGSCSAQACPGLIDAQQNYRCDQPMPPAGWTCPASAYGDGVECDCGCGVPDPDCASSAPAECARCLVCGGHGDCVGTVDMTDTTQCAPPPSGWTCSAAEWRAAVCDCGCGIPNEPCQGITLVYVCEDYPADGCTAGIPSHIDPTNNGACTVNVPSTWTCNPSYYDDGLCDCGCGAVDLDCSTNDVTNCRTCNDPGSCSTSACPGTIVADDTAHCSN